MSVLVDVLPSLSCPRCAARFELSDGSLQCRRGHAGTAAGGHWDLIGRVERLSLGQRLFATRLGARGYERFREGRIADVVTGKRYSDEIQWLEETIGETSKLVLDVPCGQGNFTAALARRVGRTLIGVDLSGKMLELAAARMSRAGLGNVLLLRADALALPLADASVDAISACGGLHLYPDVPRAIAEMRRVLRPGGVVAGLTFRRAPRARALSTTAELVGVRAFDFDELGETFRREGFGSYRWQGRRLVGWFSARAMGA
jgi:SAM-dependent methyltransferase